MLVTSHLHDDDDDDDDNDDGNDDDDDDDDDADDDSTNATNDHVHSTEYGIEFNARSLSMKMLHYVSRLNVVR
jgi:hypothetical protein